LVKTFTALAILGLAFLPGLAKSADRTVQGTVFYKGGEPAAEAAVQLEDRTTMQVMSHRTDREGHYRFLGLSPDKDYELRAHKNGHRSKSHTVSHFSSHVEETVDLYLEGEPNK
jgi:carboxypeptidase family protein